MLKAELYLTALPLQNVGLQLDGCLLKASLQGMPDHKAELRNSFDGCEGIRKTFLGEAATCNATTPD